VFDNYLLCLSCGKEVKNLGMHLRAHGLTHERYRAQYNLPADYPKVPSGLKGGRSKKGNVETSGLASNPEGNQPDVSSEESLWEQAERENIERDVSAETSVEGMEELIVQGVELAKQLDQDIASALSSEAIGDRTYGLLAVGYRIGVEGLENPKEFASLLDRYHVSVRTDAGQFVPGIKLLVAKANAKRVRGSISKFAACCELGHREGIPTDNFIGYLKSLGGWTLAYDRFQQKYGKPAAKAKREAKKLAAAKKIGILTKEVVPFAPLPANENGASPCDGYEGVGLLVFRWTSDGQNGLLGLLNVDPQKSTEIIVHHGVAVGEDETKRLIKALHPEQDNKADADGN
jgi:hypothetical protein